MLRDLTIQNYRCFKDFYIDGLARVNLIVGKNNSGKTSLLEAVYLLVNRGKIQCLFELLSNRGEIDFERLIRPSSESVLRRRSYQIRHIFYGHQLISDQAIHIQSKKEYPLLFKIQLLRNQQLIIPGFEEIVPDVLTFDVVLSYGQDIKMEIPVRSDGVLRKLRTSQLENLSQSDFSLSVSNQSFFLTTNNLSFERLAMWWDEITLTPKEERVVAALQILEPSVERINFTSRQTFNSGILLKLRGQNDPVPLGSMGEGMRRILTLAMAAVTAENGVLLVDEIDTGLYYETQTDMWRLILELAQQLNVQVFATTHSWDCICAFQEALEQLEDSSVGKLFRLSQRDDNIRPVAYTADELAIAVPHSIEVR